MSTFSQTLAAFAQKEREAQGSRGLAAALRRNARDIAAYKETGGQWITIARALDASGEASLPTATPEDEKRSLSKLRKRWSELQDDPVVKSAVEAARNGAATAEAVAAVPEPKRVADEPKAEPKAATELASDLKGASDKPKADTIMREAPVAEKAEERKKEEASEETSSNVVSIAPERAEAEKDGATLPTGRRIGRIM